MCGMGLQNRKVAVKYGNKLQTFNGEKYRSKKEMMRHLDLLTLQRCGKISCLTREVPFQLVPSVVVQGRKRPPIRYLADFVYHDGTKQIIEDCKGFRTQVYTMKRHMMKAVHDIDILET